MRENLSHDLVPPPKDKGILVYENDRGVTIHIPCGLFRFRLLPFDYFDSIKYMFLNSYNITRNVNNMQP